MAQLPYVEPDEADPVTKDVYDKAEARFEMVLNIFKISGNAPEIAEKMWEIFFEILKDGQVDWKTKELLILKSTKMGDCLYCVTQHEAVSSRLGISREKQADIVGVEYRDSPHYIDAEIAILDLCSHVVLDPEGIPSDVWERVREHYDDGQIIEILTTIGAYLQVSKFGDAMGVKLEEAFHGHDPVLFEEEPPESPAAQEHFEHFKQHAEG